MAFDFEFLKDRYDFELDRKDKLTDALALPIGILTGAGGLLAAMVRTFTYDYTDLTSIFVTLLILNVIGFVLCAFFMWRAYLAQTYVYLPLLEDLDVAQREIQEFNSYVENSGGDVHETSENFNDHLRSRIIKAADTNTKSNDLRARWLHNGRIALFGVLCLTALAGIPYLLDQVQTSLETIVPDPPRPPSATRTPPSPPPRPTFPDNRVIKEGSNPQKK